MSEYVEQHQRFAFDDQQWTVVKYDNHPHYRQKMTRLQGTKAVDFIALHNPPDETLYWIEVKDFRGYRIQNKCRLSSGELATKVGEKVRDSVAGVVGAYHTQGQGKEWRQFVRAIWRKSYKIHVLLWMEEDNIPGPLGRRQNAAQVQAQELKRRLGWLTPRVFVVSRTLGSCPQGLVVTDLPGAGQP